MSGSGARCPAAGGTAGPHRRFKGHPRRTTGAQEPSPRQRTTHRIALADARCNREAGLLATARGLDTRYRASVLQQVRADVLAWRDLQRQALDRAPRLAPEVARPG